MKGMNPNFTQFVILTTSSWENHDADWTADDLLLNKPDGWYQVYEAAQNILVTFMPLIKLTLFKKLLLIEPDRKEHAAFSIDSAARDSWKTWLLLSELLIIVFFSTRHSTMRKNLGRGCTRMNFLQVKYLNWIFFSLILMSRLLHVQ